MSAKEKALLMTIGHEVHIVDYMPGEPAKDDDWKTGRFCLECIDCGQILFGERTLVGAVNAISVTVS